MTRSRARLRRRRAQPRCAVCPQAFWMRCLYMPLVRFRFFVFTGIGIDQSGISRAKPIPAECSITNKRHYASCQPMIAPPQLSRWEDEPSLSPVTGRVPRALGPPHARRGRVARIVLLRARGSCESRVPDPSDASQGDQAKSTVDETGDHISGLVLPLAAPEALRVDRSLLSAVRHELFDAS